MWKRLGLGRRRRNLPVQHINRQLCNIGFEQVAEGVLWKLTSPSRCCILKLRLLTLRDGEPGKQYMQFVRDESRSISICDMLPTKLYCCCCNGTDIFRPRGS